MKRITAILLCMAMLLSLAACGSSESSTAAIQETTAPAETVPVETEPPAIFLDTTYSVNNRLESGEIEVHSVTAQDLGDTVLYDVEYTAPEGMYLQVAGTTLARCWDYMTSGGKDHFTFEIGKTDACRDLDTLTVLYKFNSWNVAELAITTAWHETETHTLVQVPITNPGDGDFHFDRITARAVTEDMLHFQVEYTTPPEEQYYAGFSLADVGKFFDVGVAPGKDMITLMMPREKLEAAGAILVDLYPQSDMDAAVVTEIRPGDFTLPQGTTHENVQTVSIDPADLGSESVDSGTLKLSGILLEQTTAGNLYTMSGDFSNVTSATAYCNIGPLYYTVTSQIHNPQQIQHFIPADIVTRSMSLVVEFWGENGFVGAVYLPDDCTPIAATVHHPGVVGDVATEEPAVGQFLQYPNWNSENRLKQGEVEIFGVTESVLENGNTRYIVEYQAPAGMNIHAFDPPRGEHYRNTRLQDASGRREFFVFDVEPSAMEKIQEITINCESYKSGNFFLFLKKNRYNAQVTEGNPIGEPQDVKVQCDRKVAVHSMTAQELDNGYIRYTMTFTTDAGRRVSFFNQPNNNHFLYLSETLATGGEDSYVIDIPKADNNDVREITMKFYDLAIGDHVYARFKPPVF